MNHRYNSLFLCSMLAVSAVAAPNNDKVNQPTLSDTARVYDIDEVVVVEQPKETYRLRQQPLSSNSFSMAQLNGLHVQDLRQLSSFVPSFSMPEYGSRITSAMYVRGIGSRISSPAVGVYLDGMPLQSKSAFNFHTYDLNRVDVLHGPQGTLYGMNTEGGLIRMYSKNPFAYQGTDVTLSVGTKFWRKAEVSHYEKLSDKVAYSLAGFYDGSNGFLVNQYNGERADKYDEFGGRARLLWKPSQRWQFDFTADYQYTHQNGFAYGQVVTKDMIGSADITSPYYALKAGTQDPNTNRQGTYRRNMLNTGIGIKYAGKAFEFNSMTSYQLLNDNMLMDIDYLPKDYMYMQEKQLQNSLTQELSFKSRGDGFWHWTFGGFASYSWLRTDAPVTFGKAMDSYLSTQTSSYVYNAILGSMTQKIYQQLIGTGMDATKAQAAASVAAKAAILAAGGAQVDMTMGTVPGTFHTPTYNLGLYHESNIEIGKSWVATLGARYDFSHVAIDYATQSMLQMDEKVMGQEVKASLLSELHHSEKNHFNQFLPKVGLTYKLGAKGNIYALFTKGYRAGGYNIQMFSDILQNELAAAAMTVKQAGDVTLEHDEATYNSIKNTISYKPETSWNYELGTHLDLAGGSLKLDVATFFMQIRNQQLSVMSGMYGFGRMMTNAGKSHSCGIEATLRGAALNDKLTYSLSYGFISSRFDEYTDSVRNGSTYDVVDYKDKKVPYVPQHTFSAAADYTVNIDPNALLDPTNRFHLRDVTFGLNVAGQGQTYWDEQNSISQNFYATLGAHVLGNFGPMTINLWARNITDSNYNTFVVQSSATGEKLTFAQLGHPFQMGVDVKFHF